MENLPILKTAWAVNKQVLNAFFAKGTFFKFILPLVVIQALYVALDFFGLNGLSHTVNENGETITEVENMSAFILAMLVSIVSFFSVVVAAIRWHRKLILGEDVVFSAKDISQFLTTFLFKSVLITLMVGAVSVFFITLSGIFMALSVPGEEGMALFNYLGLLGAAVSIVALLFVAVRVFPALYLVLPATAVDVPLTFKKAVAYMDFKIGLRFSLTMLCAFVMVTLPLLVLVYWLFLTSLFTSVVGTVLVFGVMALVTTYYIFPAFGVLSVYFVHYILPKISAEDALLEE